MPTALPLFTNSVIFNAVKLFRHALPLVNHADSFQSPSAHAQTYAPRGLAPWLSQWWHWGWPGLPKLNNTVGDPKQHCYDSLVPWRVAEESLQDCSCPQWHHALIPEQRYSAQQECQWISPDFTLIVASFTTVAVLQQFYSGEKIFA